MKSPVLTSLQAAAGVAVLARLATGARRHDALIPVLEGDIDSVSVVIPARNEAERIGACLEGLADEPVHEVLVIDDGSTDATTIVAESFGATVKRAEPLPEGWIGKPWALQQGLEHAAGDWVLFLDADTRPKPGLVRSILKQAKATDMHVTSLSARFATNSSLQATMHASFLAGLVYRFGPTGTHVAPAAHRTMMNGQCVLVRREWLLAQGGFALSAANMTDDIALAQGLVRRGARIGFFDGSAVLDVAMYGSTEETWREWGRSLPMADVSAKRTQAVDAATLLLTQVLPVLRLVTGRTTVIDKVLLALRFALIGPLRSTFVHPPRWLWLSPRLDPATVGRLIAGTVRPAKSWRGRTYH